MDVDAVRRDLAGTRFAEVRWVAETGSTNDDLLAEAATGIADGAVLVAGHQTAGRGRLDRRWEAPPGSSLLCSVLVRPSLPPEDRHLLTMAMGVAAAQAVAATSGVSPLVKWPNDLVVLDGGVRKLAGVLAEAVGAGDDAAVVIGIGVNVRWPADLPEDLAAIATAINHLTGEPPTTEALLVALLQSLDAWCSQVDTGDAAARDVGAAALLAAHDERSATLGRHVRVDRGADVVEGTATGVSRTGHLLVEDAAGRAVEVAVGDVVQVRPTDGGAR